jgi:predicted nuclease of predicted toxin-antitoxin system
VKILLDECLPVDFRHSFPQHQAHTVEWAGLKGRQNGDLLRSAEAAGYQVLLTVDQGIPHQQAPAGRTIALIVIRSRTNQLVDLLPVVPEITATLNEPIQPGRISIIPIPA